MDAEYGHPATFDSPAWTGRWLRLRGGALALLATAALVAAASLEPNSGGYGTHRQFSLPACSFLARTGYPCPSCGMTTSMAAMAHADFAAAGRAHPFGMALFVGVALLGVAGLAELSTGRNLLGRLPSPIWWICGALVGMFAGWGWKVAVGVATGEFPLR